MKRTWSVLSAEVTNLGENFTRFEFSIGDGKLS